MVSQNPYKTIGKLWFRAIVELLMGPVRELISVRPHCHTVENRSENNVSVPGLSMPRVEPVGPWPRITWFPETLRKPMGNQRFVHL